MKIGMYDLNAGDHFISVYEPIAGWKWIEYWINPDMGGFVEPYTTSQFPFDSEDIAIHAGKSVAEALELPFIYKG